jgi:hypothetical protein
MHTRNNLRAACGAAQLAPQSGCSYLLFLMAYCTAFASIRMARSHLKFRRHKQDGSHLDICVCDLCWNLKLLCERIRKVNVSDLQRKETGIAPQLLP